MVMIDGQTAIREFKKRYRDRASDLRLINAFVRSLTPEVKFEPGLTPVSLLEFTNDFIEDNSYETQSIAVALASLQRFIEYRAWKKTERIS